MAQSDADDAASGAGSSDAVARRVIFAEVDYDRITPDKAYNFTLKKSGDDTTTNIDWLTCSLVIDSLLDGRATHLRSLSHVPEADRVYKPGVWLIPEYNIEFLLVVSNYFKDFQFPANVKVRLWWSADDGDAIFRAHLLRQFRDGKTGLDAIMQTSAGYNLDLDPHDPKTADTLYLATPRAIYKCESLRPLLSPQAQDLLIQEDKDRRALSYGNGPIMDPDSRSAWEDGLKYGF
ncbi:hypothetical protein ColTof4_01217 [Colletotrichum tofieldiae]|nr:hypothetical protein ColTof3_08451 [Colletotrichum tofieldiae]GKT68794.1 hypothetical protein ColTof4_01217 [Colletotrichum tofieldiae]